MTDNFVELMYTFFKVEGDVHHAVDVLTSTFITSLKVSMKLITPAKPIACSCISMISGTK